jgi:hypothetical protein
MPKKHDTPAIRAIVGALDFQHVAVKEIRRRLAEQECGLPYAVEISERQVRNYRQAYRDEHGMPPSTVQTPDARSETIDAVLERAVGLLGREVTAYEAKRRGSITPERLKTLDTLHGIARRWQRAQATAAGKLTTSQIGTNERTRPKAQPQESTIERLAREEREQKAATPVETLAERARRMADELGRKADAA